MLGLLRNKCVSAVCVCNLRLQSASAVSLGLEWFVEALAKCSLAAINEKPLISHLGYGNLMTGIVATHVYITTRSEVSEAKLAAY